MSKGKPIKKYQDGLKENMVGFTTELTKVFPDLRITSGFRPRAFTKQGAVSRHALGEAIDIEGRKDVYDYLWNTKEGVSLLNRFNVGVLDETTPEMLEKTGGTGAHYHIGADSTLVPKAKQRYKELTGSDTPMTDYFVNPYMNQSNNISILPETEINTTFASTSLDYLKNEELKKQQENQTTEETGTEQYTPQENNFLQDLLANISLGVEYVKPVQRNIMQSGGKIIKDNNGYWNPKNWGKQVEISSPNITMQGVNQPLWGTSKETGETKLMMPEEDYYFQNTKNVIETPTYQQGGEYSENENNFLEDINNYFKSYQEGGEFIDIDRGNGKIESINTNSDEYKELYNQGLIGSNKVDNTIAVKPFEEVTVTAFRKTKSEDLQQKAQVDEQELQQRLENPYNFETQKDAMAVTKDEILPEVKKGQKLPNIKEIKELAKMSDEEMAIEKLLTDRQNMFNNRSNNLNPDDDLPTVIDTTKIKTKDDIIKVQRGLKELGYNLNPKGNFENDGIDGKLGNVTKGAISTYNKTKDKNIYSSYKEGEGFLGRCKEEQCSEYAQNEVFRNLKPNVSRGVWNKETGLFGDAWTIGKHIEQAGGSKVEKVKPGDAVTMYTGGASSYLGEAKKHGTDATHIGIVDKVNPDGSYYILHNVHEGSRGNYTGREYRDLVKDNKIVSGGVGRSFTIRGAYRPNYDAIKDYDKKTKVRDDISIRVNSSKVKELENLNRSKTGENIQANIISYTQSINNNKNKKVLTQKHGINEEEYQSIAKISLGIIGQESSFGTSDKADVKRVGAEIREFFGGKEASRGDAQIKYETNYGDTDLTELGINKSNFTDSDKTPLVVIDRIATYYKQLLKKGESKENAMYKAVEKYNRGRNTKYSDVKDSDYVNKVINFSELFVVEDLEGKTYNTTTDKLLLEKQVIKKKLGY